MLRTAAALRQPAAAAITTTAANQEPARGGCGTTDAEPPLPSVRGEVPARLGATSHR